MRTTMTVSDGVARIRMDNPPINALAVNNGFVRELTEAVRAALADRQVAALVVHGGGQIFCGGADIVDFDDPQEARRINMLLDMVEQSDKPIVMALHGAAFGGGLELAMAGHYRVCTPDARLGLPDMALGLSGTQRLPRLVGTKKALDLMLCGEIIDGREAHRIGLVDRVAIDDLLTAATRWAGEMVAGPMRSSRLAQAPPIIVNSVDATTAGSPADGLAAEARPFDDLPTSDAAREPLDAFLRQRRVARIPDFIAGLAQTSIESIAVIGAGTVGAGITASLLNAGRSVTLIDPDVAMLATGGKEIALTIDRDVERRRLDPDAAMVRMSLLRLGGSLEAAADADLIIEAAFEDIDDKRDVFRTLDRIAKPRAILASNNATPDLDAIADATSRPDHVIGLDFFSPADATRLLEVVRGRRTAPEVLGAAMDFAKRIGRVGVVAGVGDSFIGDRIFEEYLRQAFFLLEEGALPADIDAALEAWGMAMGPIRALDLAGQDIGWTIRKRRALERPDQPYSRIPDLVCELGRFGRKTGAGFYLYPDGCTPRHDPAIDELVMWHSADLGIKRRPISDAEIVERCILAMINEGARLLAAGLAYRPIDIDAIYVNAYGFPAARGGPMFHADLVGLPEVLRQIRRFAGGPNGRAWEPAPLLVELVRRGADFALLDEVGGVMG